MQDDDAPLPPTPWQRRENAIRRRRMWLLRAVLFLFGVGAALGLLLNRAADATRALYLQSQTVAAGGPAPPGWRRQPATDRPGMWVLAAPVRGDVCGLATGQSWIAARLVPPRAQTPTRVVTPDQTPCKRDGNVLFLFFPTTP